jgi:hypothetical protein
MYPEFENCIPKPNLGGERYPDLLSPFRIQEVFSGFSSKLKKSQKRFLPKGEPFQFHHNFTQAKVNSSNGTELYQKIMHSLKEDFLDYSSLNII